MKQDKDLKSKCANGLKSLAPSLTAHDKQQAADKFKVHKNTVLNYLSGRVGDEDLGLKMLEFFNKRISDRVEKMHKILAA
jgi:hypothetical protein